MRHDWRLKWALSRAPLDTSTLYPILLYPSILYTLYPMTLTQWSDNCVHRERRQCWINPTELPQAPISRWWISPAWVSSDKLPNSLCKKKEFLRWLSRFTMPSATSVSCISKTTEFSKIRFAVLLINYPLREGGGILRAHMSEWALSRISKMISEEKPVTNGIFLWSCNVFWCIAEQSSERFWTFKIWSTVEPSKGAYHAPHTPTPKVDNKPVFTYYPRGISDGSWFSVPCGGSTEKIRGILRTKTVAWGAQLHRSFLVERCSFICKYSYLTFHYL